MTGSRGDEVDDHRTEGRIGRCDRMRGPVRTRVAAVKPEYVPCGLTPPSNQRHRWIVPPDVQDLYVWLDRSLEDLATIAKQHLLGRRCTLDGWHRTSLIGQRDISSYVLNRIGRGHVRRQSHASYLLKDLVARSSPQQIMTQDERATALDELHETILQLFPSLRP